MIVCGVSQAGMRLRSDFGYSPALAEFPHAKNLKIYDGYVMMWCIGNEQKRNNQCVKRA